VFKSLDGEKLCTIGGNSGAVLTIDTGKKTDQFIWGSSERQVRVMDISDVELDKENLPESEEAEILGEVSMNKIRNQQNEETPINSEM
jgi:hypothetical protein